MLLSLSLGSESGLQNLLLSSFAAVIYFHQLNAKFKHLECDVFAGEEFSSLQGGSWNEDHMSHMLDDVIFLGALFKFMCMFGKNLKQI